jgi:release factor glutamine methyltransferase
VAVDCSTEALAIAHRNAQTHLPDFDPTTSQSRLSLRQGSWFAPLDPERGQLTGLVANPPYIPRAEVAALQPEVTDHEPHLALDGGLDGLDALRHLVTVAPDYLRSGGVWLVELMAGQAPSVAQLLHDRGAYQGVEILRDWAGIERFVLARRR